MLFHLILAVALLVGANASVLPRLTGGNPAYIVDAPYIVALLGDANGNGVFTQGCAAVIISRTAVITSVRCTDLGPAQLRIRAASSYHITGGQVIDVSAIKIHEKYSKVTFDNDLAILYLAFPISFGLTAAAVILPNQGATVEDYVSGAFYGWGALADGGTLPIVLHEVELPTVNQNICKAAYSNFKKVTGNMICAGYYGYGGFGPCQNDHGGPLVINKVLFGIFSWNKGCGQSDSPGVFTRIPMYRYWIDANL